MTRNIFTNQHMTKAAGGLAAALMGITTLMELIAHKVNPF